MFPAILDMDAKVCFKILPKRVYQNLTTFTKNGLQLVCCISYLISYIILLSSSFVVYFVVKRSKAHNLMEILIRLGILFANDFVLTSWWHGIYFCRSKTEEMAIEICTHKLSGAGLVVGETL